MLIFWIVSDETGKEFYMNFEKKMSLIRSLKKAGITSAKALSEFTSDIHKLLDSGLSKDEMINVVNLADQVGKSNAFFDWLLADA